MANAHGAEDDYLSGISRPKRTDPARKVDELVPLVAPWRQPHPRLPRDVTVTRTPRPTATVECQRSMLQTAARDEGMLRQRPECSGAATGTVFGSARTPVQNIRSMPLARRARNWPATDLMGDHQAAGGTMRSPPTSCLEKQPGSATSALRVANHAVDLRRQPLSPCSTSFSSRAALFFSLG